MAAPSIYGNPTGAIGNGGITPPTGGAGNYNFGNSMSTTPAASTGNPYALQIPTAHPVMAPPGDTPANVGANALDPYGIIGTQTYTDNASALGNELGKVYGKGGGTLAYDYLQSGAGYAGGLTQQAVDSTTAAMQHQIGQGWQDIATNLGASGISMNSSTAALAQGDYFSQAVANENAITAQDYFNMWNASQQREASMIPGLEHDLGTQKANAPTIMSVLGMSGAAVGTGADIWSTLAGIIPGLG